MYAFTKPGTPIATSTGELIPLTEEEVCEELVAELDAFLDSPAAAGLTEHQKEVAHDAFEEGSVDSLVHVLQIVLMAARPQYTVGAEHGPCWLDADVIDWLRNANGMYDTGLEVGLDDKYNTLTGPGVHGPDCAQSFTRPNSCDCGIDANKPSFKLWLATHQKAAEGHTPGRLS